MIKKFIDFQLFEHVVPIRDSDFPKEVNYQEYTEYRSRKLDTFNTREVDTIWFNKNKSPRGGSNVMISLSNSQFVINVKKRKKIGFGRNQVVKSRFYNFYIRKLQDEYYLISGKFDTNERIINGYESSVKNDSVDHYWIADTFTELKSFMDRVISFSKTSAINF